MVGIPSAVNAAQEIAAEVSPAPVQFKHTVFSKHVIARLKWGRPDLTIIDVRDRESFNCDRIMGAICIPASENLVATVKQFAETNRDLYLYGNSDEDIINSAAQLDRAGFTRVAVIEDGLSGWKDAGGATEGRNA